MIAPELLARWSRHCVQVFGSSIVYRATAGLVALALGLVLGLGAVSYLAMRDLAGRSAHDRIAAELELIRERTELQLDAVIVELGAVAQHPLLVDALGYPDRGDARLAAMLRDLTARRPWLQWVSLRDARGRALLVQSNGTHSVPPELLESTRTDPFAVLAPHATDKLLATVVFPVRSPPTEAIEGFIAAQIDLAGSARSAMARGTGSLTTRVVAIGEPLSAGSQQRVVLRLRAPLSEVGVCIEATVAPEGAFGEFDRLRQGFALVALLAVLIVVPLAAILVRQVTLPLVRLTAAVLNIADGGLSSARALCVRGDDELSKLARSFNHMLDALRESQQTLEQRVDQRTRELADTRARLESIVGSLRDVVVSFSADGQRVLYVSAAAKKVFGIEPERFYLEPDRLHEMILPGDQEEFVHAIASADSDSETHVEFRIEASDGSVRWLEMRIRLNGDRAAGWTRIDGVICDITERVVAEIDRSYALVTLRLKDRALDSSSNGIVISDVGLPDAPIIYANKAFEQLTGYKPGEVQGINCRFLQGRDSQQEAVGVLRGAVAAGEACRVVLRNYRKDGTMFWNELTVSPVHDDDGRVTHFVGIQNDITDRVNAQAEIAERSERLDAIFSLSPDGFVTIDESGRVSAVNPTFERMTGISRELIAGRDERWLEATLRRLADPRQAWPGLHGGSSEGEDGETGRETTLALILPAPAIIHHRIRRSHSRQASRVLYFRDVTRVSELDQMKSEFLSTAAHELRTPMASIRGFCELLLKRKYDEATQRDLLDTINRQAVRLTNLLNELLDLARIEARRGKDFKFKVQPLEPLVQEVVAGMIFEKDPRKVQVSIECEVPQVNVDHEKLQQALMNVLGNAYKYSPNGGAIELTVLREAGERGRVGVRVKDHGIGMSPEHSARAFERFFRADTSGNIPGTGLGLSLVKEIIELHGGEVRLQSAAGQGTMVTIWLPVVERETEATLA